VVGLFLKYVGFEIDITGEKWLQIFLMPPTHLVNLPDRKSYDILNLIKPMMISIITTLPNKLIFPFPGM